MTGIDQRTWQWNLNQCDACNKYNQKDNCLSAPLLSDTKSTAAKYCGWCTTGGFSICSSGSRTGPAYSCPTGYQYNDENSGTWSAGWTWTSDCRSNQPIAGSLDFSTCWHDNMYGTGNRRRRQTCACETGYQADSDGSCQKCS